MTPSKPAGADAPDEKAISKAEKDLGVDQVQDAFAEAQDKGYFGSKVDPLPDSEHSLESGPESPTAAEQARALAQADTKENA